MLFSDPKDVKDLFSVLKDSASEVSQSNTAIKHQVLVHTLLLDFSVLVLFSVKHYRFVFQNFISIKTIKHFHVYDVM